MTQKLSSKVGHQIVYFKPFQDGVVCKNIFVLRIICGRTLVGRKSFLPKVGSELRNIHTWHDK